MIVDDSVAFLQACAAELNFGGVRSSATDSDPCVSLSDFFVVHGRMDAKGKNRLVRWCLHFGIARFCRILQHNYQIEIPWIFFRRFPGAGAVVLGHLGLCEPRSLGRWPLQTSSRLGSVFRLLLVDVDFYGFLGSKGTPPRDPGIDVPTIGDWFHIT